MIKSHILNMLYVHEKCKISNFKFSKVWWATYYAFYWKFTALYSNERILQINQELTKL